MNKQGIPSTWKLGTLEDVVTGKQYSITGGPFGSDLQTKDYTIDGVQIIQLQNIGDGYFINDSKVFTSEEKANKLRSCNIFPNDIILAKMADPVARACIIPDFAKRFLMASDGIRVEVDKKNNDVYYIVSIINHYDFRKNAINNSTGTTRARIGLTDLKNIKFPIPPLLHQRKIARILTTVDNIIEKTEAAIAKYKAIKQGMMHDLFTSGIDVKTGKLRPKFEDAPELYKESELGWIPKVWDAKPLELITDYVDYRGKTPPKSETGIILVTAKNIKMGNIDYEISKEYIPEYAYKSAMSRGEATIGDVLITTEAPLGNVAQVDTNGLALAQRVIKYRGKNGIIINRFLKYSLMSGYFQRQINAESTGSTVKGIKGSRLHKQNVLVPTDIDEQNQISGKIFTQENQINNEIRCLEKLEEMKSGLMQDLLTGKKEVTPDPEDFKTMEN